jgi:F-type H+-transporting ATPase subunit delta
MAQPESTETREGQEGTGARRLASVYAEALLNAADKRGLVDAVGEELGSIVGEVFASDPRIELMFASPVIKRSLKEPLLARFFQGKISDLLFDFILVLNRHERLSLLRSVSSAYQVLCDKRARRVRVKVRSAVELDDNQKQTLRDTLFAALGKDPILDTRIDPDLLGGMVVQVGDDVYDSTVRTRIDSIRNQLQASSSHEIQVRRDRFSSAS